MYGNMLPNMTKRVSISELQNNPIKYFHDCHHEPVEVVKYGKTIGYLVSSSTINASVSFSAQSLGPMQVGEIQQEEVDNEKKHSH